ncbi:MAG: hypothetical protein M3R24_01815, partial [Chloroflexota bacterium]|nr:hypothetical protein [Chloroflexota bacterium]
GGQTLGGSLPLSPEGQRPVHAIHELVWLHAPLPASIWLNSSPSAPRASAREQPVSAIRPARIMYSALARPTLVAILGRETALG